LLVSSIEAVATELRRIVAGCPFDLMMVAAELFTEGEAMLAEAAHGSAAYELPAAMAAARHGLELLREAYQCGLNSQAAIERYLAHIGATGSAGADSGGVGSAGIIVRSTTPASGPGESPTPVAPPVRRKVDQALVAEARKLGHKIAAERVVRIGRDRVQQIVWLEEGDERRGQAHILAPDRVANFVGVGIAEDDIVEVVFRAATTGRPVGTTGKDRLVFEVDYHGQPKRIAVTVASNGFIVGANPISPTGKIRPLP
jgi:hypothetical protein